MRSRRRFVESVILSVILCLATSLNAATPWLHTDANKIKDPDGNIVVLRGLDTIDLGSVELWRGGVINLIDRITNKSDSSGSSPGWYPRVIRLAVYPQDETDTSGPWYWEPNPDNYYNNLLRPVVDYCKLKDIYAIIDWHYVGDDTWTKVTQTSAFWSYMAPRFAGDSHVLFELFNEPLNTSPGNEAQDWASCKADMQTWIDIIRTSAPNNLILVAGPSWSQQIGPSAADPFPTSNPHNTNIVMVAHIYPGHWLSGSQSWYLNHIATALTRYPVFMSEWGFCQTASYDLLRGTITNYGQPLWDWREARKISNSAWVTDYAWEPPMFNSNWTLRVGENEMGGFTKDLLYTYRNNDQPGGGDTTPPAAPTGLSATGGEQTVSLNWNDNSELDLAGYNVYRSITSGSGYVKLNGSPLTSSNYTDNNVDGYVTYYYVVTAVDTSLNESVDSSEVSATPTDTTPPSAPTGLSATAGDGTVSLNWNDNGEDDLDGYNVYRSTTSGSGYIKQNGSLLSSSDYIDNSVANGITYYYVVTAVDTVSNESGYSSEVSATPAIQMDVEIIGSWVSGTSHTKESGANRALIFVAHAEHTADTSLTSVTYGGQAMTKVVGRVVSSGNPVYYAYVAAYILNEAGVAAATSGTFTPAWGTSPEVAAYSSVFLSNVDQTASSGATAGNGNTTDNPITTAALSTNDGDMVIDAATCGNLGSYTLNNGFTEGTDQSVGTYGLTGVTGHKPATGASETPSATHSGPNRQVIIGFVVNAPEPPPTYSNCGQVQAAGFRLKSDLNGDCYVNYLDVNTMAYYWLNGVCDQTNNYCGLADFEPRDGAVDFFDFSDFAMQWLLCNDPEDPECSRNW